MTNRSDGREARAMEAATFFDRLAASVATSPRAVTALRREAVPSKAHAEQMAAEGELEQEMGRGRRVIAAERERWLAERRTA
jgi:hypothetical protein